MSYHCFKCGKELQLLSGNKVPRKESCPNCGSDMHVCYNCQHHDRTAYNECRESQAERVLDKDRSNFCDYFSFREGSGHVRDKQSQGKAEHLKNLDNLFKK